MEQLDHRQLLSVNFTGNVPIDFPATQTPGVVVLPDNPLVQHPPIAPAIQPIVKVSGFDISGIRVTYTAADDTLSIGIDQPPSQNHAGEVIAGDADNNGNPGTVNPAVTNTPGFSGFLDPANFGGDEHMAAFLDFLGTGEPQIVAGFSPVPPAATPTDLSPQKLYQVAQAIPTGPNSEPIFGTELPQFEGNFYNAGTVAHPNFEFAIRDFSALYQSITGKALTSTSVISMGAFAGSGTDVGIGEAFFPEQPFTLGAATLPTAPPCIISPPILVNPHEHRVIDTGHRDLVRVYVLGTSGFDVTTINPATVELNGAKPIAHFTRRFPHDEFLNAVYVFVGNQINLPAGSTTATFTAQTFSGMQITSSKQVLNIPFSARVPGHLHFLLDKGSAYPGLNRIEQTQASSVTLQNASITPPQRVTVNPAPRAAAQPVQVNYQPQVSSSRTSTAVSTSKTVVPLTRPATALTSKVRDSLRTYLSQADLIGTRAKTAGGAR
jgi:hypothetical protein